MNFSDTKVAFSSKNSGELRKTMLLFKIMGSGTLLVLGKTVIQFFIALRLPIKWMVSPIFKHFCGGENIYSCSETIKHLGKFNIGTILDYSVEGKNDKTSYKRTTDEIICTIERAANDQNIPFSVFKITGLLANSLLKKLNSNHEGKNLSSKDLEEYLRFKERYEAICKAAHKHSVKLFIDAEETWYQEAIDAWALEAMGKFNTEKAIIYNTVQLYRNDRLQYLEELNEKAKAGNFYVGLKLVRGAYMEKERREASEENRPSPINENKKTTDDAFNKGLLFCLENIERVAICAGTHNDESTMLLCTEMEKRGIAHNDERIYFAQLLGMSDHLSFNLANAGYNVGKYVPYGPVKEVMPYLIRRAEENSSVKGQTGRELGLLHQEVTRRKNA